MTYFCPECGNTEEWSAKLFSEKGEPVCSACDNDMKLCEHQNCTDAGDCMVCDVNVFVL